MSEGFLTVAAMAFELGIPLTAVFVMFREPRLRKVASVILGSVMPLILFFAFVSISYAVNPSDKSNTFAFHAMWVMAFAGYAALLLFGLVLSFIPKPTNSWARFFIGCASAPVAYVLLRIVS